MLDWPLRPLRDFLRLAGILAYVALTLPVAIAQTKPATTVERRARSLANQLELDERRVDAVAQLLALGKDAVAALSLRLDDPRPEVVEIICQTLCALGPTAAAAAPELRAAARSKNPAIARMARMTLLSIEPTNLLTVCEFGKKRIVQLALLDATVAERELLTDVRAWDVDLLPDNHLLVTLFGDGKVVEYDGKGTEIWSFAALKSPLEADRLLNGNTLIADQGNARVIEVDAKGKIVWEYPTPRATPYDVERLANGHTLITIYPDRVLEVDRAGKIVWELGELEGVFDADRLPNGNTLITLYRGGAVREVNQQREVVWQAKVTGHPNEADRLPNGNTLVTTSTNIVEIAPDGSIVRELARGTRVSKVTSRVP